VAADLVVETYIYTVIGDLLREEIFSKEEQYTYLISIYQFTPYSLHETWKMPAQSIVKLHYSWTKLGLFPYHLVFVAV